MMDLSESSGWKTLAASHQSVLALPRRTCDGQLKMRPNIRHFRFPRSLRKEGTSGRADFFLSRNFVNPIFPRPKSKVLKPGTLEPGPVNH